MEEKMTLEYIKQLIERVPADWLNLTTHRLDIYEEKLAKTQFLERFEDLYKNNNLDESALKELPTAFDYIRLGHPLSCVLEWAIANSKDMHPDQVISFSSRTIPVLAVLRKNLFAKKPTQIVYTKELPDYFDAVALKEVYGYNFQLKQVSSIADIEAFEGSTVYIDQENDLNTIELHDQIDFYLHLDQQLGSILLLNGEASKEYISEIQHVRRRETIAMTPINCYKALKRMVGESISSQKNVDAEKEKVLRSIKNITGTTSDGLIASSGLSMQYAIMMGLIDQALQLHPEKAIKIIVPPNCYGGTNDQARRVAACIDTVEILDLPVDGDNDMVQSTKKVLDQVAKQDAVPYIIAEIPTNPRVEVPDLEKLKDALIEERLTASGEKAVDPVFILDQTFCPNFQFLGEGDILSTVKAISYVSGSKFPSGGKCTAGYCVANNKAAFLLDNIDKHLTLCDNQATDLQVEILAQQLPSMNDRIQAAYVNTREFVNFIKTQLPAAKINFVSEELAEQGFTPSVFSLDLPTKGSTDEERESYKRALNLKLINKMIAEIPGGSKYCVSYGQLKGCYWTIPATSTQGTTKEGDKDYIVRVAMSGNMDLEMHKKVFSDFVSEIED